jgi:hypothetical protein
MTEQEWLTCTDPTPMLQCLHGKATKRKLRLFACACCRQVWRLLKDEASRQAVETSESFADGGVTAKELARAARKAKEVADLLRSEASLSMRLATWAARDAAASAAMAAEQRLDADRLAATAGMVRGAVTYTPDRPKCQCALLRDLFGNPFQPQPAVDPAWLVWHNGTARKLAGTVYAEHRFSDLPVLADALEDAGCADAEVLNHCRQPGQHVRGCWAIDLLLGKG